MRKDGTRVKNANPIYTVMPYVLKYRYDAMNMIEIDIPISPMQAYLNEKRKQGYRFSHLGLVLAAYVRTAAEFPCSTASSPTSASTSATNSPSPWSCSSRAKWTVP